MSSTTRWVGRLSAPGEISEADRALVNSVQNRDLAALRAALAAGANPQIEWSFDAGPYHSETILGFASHQITSLTYGTYGLSANDPSLDFVNALLEAGADPNQPELGGRTPVHRAAMGGRYNVLVRLLAAGGDVTVADQHGTLPIDGAIVNHHPDPFKFEDQQIICALLRADKAGATIPPKRELDSWTRHYRYSRAVDWIVRQGGFAAHERSRRLKLMATLDIYLRARQLPDIALSAIVTFSGNPGDCLGDPLGDW